MRWWILTGLGSGALPAVPGTWGSAVVVAAYLLLAGPGLLGAVGLNVTFAAVAIVSTVLCVWLGPWAEQHWGRKDPGQVNLDEFAGQALALLWLPLAGHWSMTLVAGAAAFVAFRAFDILKPFPANRLQRLPAGWGIVVDDLVAGVYANLAAQVFLRVVLGL